MEAVVGPEFSRRQMFLVAGLAAAAAAAPAVRRVTLPSGWSWLSAASSGGGSGAGAGGGLTLSRFAPHVGSDFTLRTGTLGGVTVTLDQATARTPHPADERSLSEGEAFSLVFRGRGTPAMAGGVHTLVHPVLGSFPLFVAPVDRAGARQDYQAVVDTRVPTR